MEELEIVAMLEREQEEEERRRQVAWCIEELKETCPIIRLLQLEEPLLEWAAADNHTISVTCSLLTNALHYWTARAKKEGLRIND